MPHPTSITPMFTLYQKPIHGCFLMRFPVELVKQGNTKELFLTKMDNGVFSDQY